MSNCQKQLVQNEKFDILVAEKRAIHNALMQLCDRSMPRSNGRPKNRSDSINFRNIANQLYREYKHDSRIPYKLISKSIAFAQNESEELVLGYWARSEILMDLGKHKESIEDIDRCLELTKYEHLKSKFNSRRLTYKTMLENLDKENEKKKNTRAMKNKHYTKKKIPFKPSSKNPYLSDAAELKYNKKDGRHFIASRKIYPGEVIVFEKAYMSSVYASGMYTHCSHCLKECWNSIPCEGCAYDMYCSTRCKNEAWTRYHDIECSVIADTWNIDDPEVIKVPICLRLFIQAIKDAGGLSELEKELLVKARNDFRLKEPTQNRNSNVESYLHLYRHMSTVPNRNIDACIKNAIHLLYFLTTKTSLFGKNLDFKPKNLAKNDDIIFAGALLLRHLQSAYDIAYTYHNLVTSREPLRVGGCLMPFSYHFNHSCDQNVASFITKGEQRVVFALHPIEKDEQLFDNYGCHHAFTDVHRRQSYLFQTYNFTCRCVPCREYWPLLKDIPNFQQVSEFIDPSKIKTLKLISHIFDKCFMKEFEDDPSTLEDLKKLITSYRDSIAPPYAELIYLIARFRKCFVSTYGD